MDHFSFASVTTETTTEAGVGHPLNSNLPSATSLAKRRIASETRRLRLMSRPHLTFAFPLFMAGITAGGEHSPPIYVGWLPACSFDIPTLINRLSRSFPHIPEAA
jgi:hypothetical protein